MGNVKLVREHDWGIYVWRLPDGTFLNDGNQNFLNIPSKHGDISKMNKIAQVAKAYGFPEGSPVFLDGNHRISDEEWEMQRARMAAGLTPDPYDAGDMKDEIRRYRRGE